MKIVFGVIWTLKNVFRKFLKEIDKSYGFPYFPVQFQKS